MVHQKALTTIQHKNTFQGFKHQTQSCRRSGRTPWWLNCSEKSSSSSYPNSKMILIYKSVSQIASSPERSQGPLSLFSSPFPRFPHQNGWMISLHTPLYCMIDVTVSLFQFSIQTPSRCRCNGEKKVVEYISEGGDQMAYQVKSSAMIWVWGYMFSDWIINRDGWTKSVSLSNLIVVTQELPILD